MTEEPKRRGRPPKVMAQPLDRLASLTAREKALAIRARARHRYTFDMPLEMYESLLGQAESWDQPLPDVVRACIRKGLEHINQFGGGAAANPFIYGQLNPPTQADIDPTGMGWPPTGGSVGVYRQPAQAWDVPPPEMIRQDLPPPMRMKTKITPGMLPNGATVSLADHEPAVPQHGIPPQALENDDPE